MDQGARHTSHAGVLSCDVDSSILGFSLEIDLQSMKIHEFVRIKVGVRNVENIPATLVLNLGGFLHELDFEKNNVNKE